PVDLRHGASVHWHLPGRPARQTGTGSGNGHQRGAHTTGEPMDRARAHIRPYRPADLDALYQICLQTGDDGRDATPLFHDPRLLGHFFAAPYGLFEPSLAFVAEDAHGVAGYILGALDTRAFEQQLERNWWPALRARYPEPPPGLPPEQWIPDQHM